MRRLWIGVKVSYSKRCIVKAPHWGTDIEPSGEAERWKNLGRAKNVTVNWWVFFVFSFLFSVSPTLTACPPPPLFLSLGPQGSPSAFPLSLIFHSPWLEPSKGSQHAHTQCQAAGAAVCEHSSISHISSLQQEQPSKTPQTAHAHTLHRANGALARVKMHQWQARRGVWESISVLRCLAH